MAQWQGTSLACVKSCVPSPAYEGKEEEGKEREGGRKRGTIAMQDVGNRES